MPIIVRQCIVIAVALLACGLGGCGTINGYLANGAADNLPPWLGGLPADAPPRPGTAKYDEYVKAREQRRLEPAPPKAEAGQQPQAAPASAPAASSLDPIH